MSHAHHGKRHGVEGSTAASGLTPAHDAHASAAPCDEPLKVVTVRIRLAQYAALDRAAHHRALVRARAVEDRSEIVREALDLWFAVQG